MGRKRDKAVYFSRIKLAWLARLFPRKSCRSDAPRTRFSWTISARCNYHCPHCCIPPDLRKDQPERIFGVDECYQAWKRIHGSRGECLIEISGGEPSIYPDFLEILKRISLFHVIGISTNLSFDVQRFITYADPRRVSLYPSFHPSEVNIETFLHNISRLRQAGFASCAGPVIVAYPAIFDRLPALRGEFAQEGCHLHLLPFQGRYRGKKYPEGYTKGERQFLKLSLSPEDAEFQLDLKNPRGKLCNAGYLYARIQNTGYAFRCAPEGELGLKHAIGFFFDKDFTLLPQPQPCINSQCPCPNEHNLQIG